MPSLDDNREAYENQIRSMKKDGKETHEIIDFFWKTYRIKLRAREVFGICHKKLKEEKFEPKKPKPAKPRKVYKCGYDVDSKFAMYIHKALQIHKDSFMTRVMEIVSKEG